MPIGWMVFLVVFVFLFGAMMLYLASLARRSKEDPIKLAPYECGVPVEKPDRSNISIKFYLTSILFIIFDIEIIFLYPWAIAFNDMQNQGKAWDVFLPMLVFILLFIFGLYWEIKSKALDWE